MNRGRDALAGEGRKGFALLELSIVLFIIAIVIGMAVTSGVSVVTTARESATLQKIKAIDEALMAFRTAQDRLPCPASLTLKQGDANYGVEGATPGTCTGGTPAANFSAGSVVEGAVPAATLGLPPDFMYDGWGNHFRYAVDATFTAVNVFATTLSGCPTPRITVNDAFGSSRSTAAVFALLSHGANGHGAYTPNGVTSNALSVNSDELTNCHCTNAAVAATYAATYVQTDAASDSSNALNGFDDIVTFKESWQLRTDWDSASTCTYAYVADYGNARIQKFDINGNYIAEYTLSSGHVGYQMALDANGHFWISTDQSEVEHYDSNFNYVGVIGGYYSSTQYGRWPVFDANGHIWVGGSLGVVEHMTDGTVLNTIPRDGTSANGSFYEYPNQAAFDPSGNLWVGDGYNARIQKFDSSGNWLMSVGGPPPQPSGCTTSPSATVPACASGSGDGQFNSIYGGNQGLAVDASGNVYVSDTYNSRIQKFNSSGTFLLTFGSYGGGDGEFVVPGALAIDPNGNLWVVDSYIQD